MNMLSGRKNAHKSSPCEELKMKRDEDMMFGICPRWAYFEATVGGEPYVFDLRDIAVKYRFRHENDLQPIHINPVTMKPFNPKTLNRLF